MTKLQIIQLSNTSTSRTRAVWHLHWTDQTVTACGVRVRDLTTTLKRPIGDLPTIPLRLRCQRCAQ